MDLKKKKWNFNAGNYKNRKTTTIYTVQWVEKHRQKVQNMEKSLQSN
jgi:hypothetical protein